MLTTDSSASLSSTGGEAFSASITLQPTLALVLAEHRIQHASGGCKEFIIVYFPCVPLTIGCFKGCAQKIRKRLIGPEDAEIALILIQPVQITQELTRNQGILGVNGF